MARPAHAPTVEVTNISDTDEPRGPEPLRTDLRAGSNPEPSRAGEWASSRRRPLKSVDSREIEREAATLLGQRRKSLSTLALTNTMSRENAPPEASPNEASAPKPNPLAKAKSFDGVENSFSR